MLKFIVEIDRTCMLLQCCVSLSLYAVIIKSQYGVSLQNDIILPMLKTNVSFVEYTVGHGVTFCHALTHLSFCLYMLSCHFKLSD